MAWRKKCCMCHKVMGNIVRGDKKTCSVRCRKRLSRGLPPDPEPSSGEASHFPDRGSVTLAYGSEAMQ